MNLKSILRLVFPLLIVGATVVACITAPQPSTTDTAGVILDAKGDPVLPVELEGYRSGPGSVSAAEDDILPSDTRFAKMVYLERDNPHDRELIHSSIVLSGGERRSLHRPEVCLPGQGWTIKSTKVISVPLEADPDFQVRDLLLEQQVPDKNGNDGVTKVQAHYIYWWVGKDTSTPYTWKRVVLTSLDNILRNVNHRWAYPSVMTVVHKRANESYAEANTRALERMKVFIQAVVPKFQKKLVKSD